MKIDTKAKTIELSSEETLGEASEQLMNMFPNGEWKEYKVLQQVITNTVTVDNTPYWLQRINTTPITAPYLPFDQPYNPPMYGDGFKITC